mmetsp:Transcript_16372/g.37739  ORF Transcript_16372/g.37739 Transcript_16372/m.37739 type:complete len:91 (+) Transcript_16372:502-774(+)
MQVTQSSLLEQSTHSNLPHSRQLKCCWESIPQNLALQTPHEKGVAVLFAKANKLPPSSSGTKTLSSQHLHCHSATRIDKVRQALTTFDID